MLPEAINIISSVEFDILENKHQIIYLEKQDTITKKQAERYHFEYREKTKAYM